jgi:YD repeat-containing protein
VKNLQYVSPVILRAGFDHEPRRERGRAELSEESTVRLTCDSAGRIVHEQRQERGRWTTEGALFWPGHDLRNETRRRMYSAYIREDGGYLLLKSLPSSPFLEISDSQYLFGVLRAGKLWEPESVS